MITFTRTHLFVIYLCPVDYTRAPLRFTRSHGWLRSQLITPGYVTFVVVRCCSYTRLHTLVTRVSGFTRSALRVCTLRFVARCYVTLRCVLVYRLPVRDALRLRSHVYPVGYRIRTPVAHALRYYGRVHRYTRFCTGFTFTRLRLHCLHAVYARWFRLRLRLRLHAPYTCVPRVTHLHARDCVVPVTGFCTVTHAVGYVTLLPRWRLPHFALLRLLRLRLLVTFPALPGVHARLLDCWLHVYHGLQI